MGTASPGQSGSQERPAAPADRPDIPAGLFALFAVVSMLALAISIVAIVRRGGDDERPIASGGPVKTLAVELGDLFVRPDRVEVPVGTQLTVEVTNNGDQEHDLNLNGEIGTDRLKPGESQTADFGVIDAEAQAWCTVPGHKEAGMVLTIAVTVVTAEPPSGPSTTG